MLTETIRRMRSITHGHEITGSEMEQKVRELCRVYAHPYEETLIKPKTPRRNKYIQSHAPPPSIIEPSFVVFLFPPVQHSLSNLTPSSSSLSFDAHVLPSPTPELIDPPAADHDTAHHVHDPYYQAQNISPRLTDQEQYRLNIELEKYSRYHTLCDGPALLGYRVLVCENRVSPGATQSCGQGIGVRGGRKCRRTRACVDCRHDGKVILKAVEMVLRTG